MTDLSDDTRDFITRAVGAERAPSSDELARIRRGVLAATVGAGTVLAGGSAVALGGKTLGATLVVSAVKGIVVGAVVTAGAIGASSYFGGSPVRDQSREVAVTPVERSGDPVSATGRAPSPAIPTAASPVPEIAIATPEPLNDGVSAPNAPSGAPRRDQGTNETNLAPNAVEGDSTAAFAPANSALAFELDVLGRAQSELRAERGAAALRILDENAGRLGAGRLGQERLAVEVLAACQAGQLERARLAARRFHGEKAATPAAARIRASCVGHEVP